jgi:hypothetical protein
MYYLFNIIIVVFIFFSGCSHTHRINQNWSAVTLTKMNQKLQGKECILFLEDKQEKVVKNILVEENFF